MHYSFQWWLLWFWSVLFSAVCYGHVRTSGFGFVFAHETIPDSLGFSKLHALVAMEVAACIAAYNPALDQDGQRQTVNEEPRTLLASDCNHVGFNIDSLGLNRKLLPINRQPNDIVYFQVMRVDDDPVAMHAPTQLHCAVATERAELDRLQHSKLDVRTASCVNDSGLIGFALFSFADDAFRTPMVRAFRVLYAPACCFRGVVGDGTAWKIGRRRFDGERFQKRLEIKHTFGQELNTRLSFFVHEPITAATQDATRHARHYSPARARKQPPPVPVLLSSAKTKNIAIFNSDRYTLLREVEELNHRLAQPVFGGSVPSLEMSGVDQWKVGQAYNLNVARSNRVPATNILLYTMKVTRAVSLIDARNEREIQRAALLGIAA